MAKKKARRSPRKRAMTLEQTTAQRKRFEARLEIWNKKLAAALKKFQHYQQKVSYYRDREDVMRRQAAEQRLAQLRHELPPGYDARDIDLSGE